MKFSQIGEKEIVNLNNGSRLGIISESDLLINIRTGKILSMLVPDRKGFLNFFSNDGYFEIPWECIRKIGHDMIIIELDEYDKKHVL
ncbi:MAG: YlmC/YmxH family sporulation protein [Clostridiales bacterium]|nr:YlmC/YmxH family sporulation protein [Clostridiales bacterium]